jgi:hypothetical protein
MAGRTSSIESYLANFIFHLFRVPALESQFGISAEETLLNFDVIAG